MVDGVKLPLRTPASLIKLSRTHGALYCPHQLRFTYDSLFLDFFIRLLSSIYLIKSKTFQNLVSR